MGPHNALTSHQLAALAASDGEMESMIASAATLPPSPALARHRWSYDILKKKEGVGEGLAIMAGEAKWLDENPISPHNHRPYSSPELARKLDVATKAEQLNVKQSAALRRSAGVFRENGKEEKGSTKKAGLELNT